MDINSNFAIQSTSSIIGKNINLFNQLSIEILTIIQKYEDNFIKDRNKLIGVGCPTASLIASFNINQSEQIRLQNIETEESELIDLIVEKTNEFRKTIIKGNKDVKEKSEKKNQNAMQHEEENTIDPTTMQSSSINDTVAQTQDYCNVLSPRLFSKSNQTQASINTSNQFIPTVSSTIVNEEYFRPSAFAVNENIFNSTVNNENEKLNETVVFKRPAAKPAAKSSKNLKNIINKQVEYFKCDIDGKTFTSKINLCNHMNNHLKIYLKHSDSKVNKKGGKICKFCGIAFLNLSMHIKKVHPEKIKKYFCKICDSKFTQKNNLNAHIKNFHTIGQTEQFECDFDGKVFKTKGLLYIHMKSHLPDVECHICHRILKFISLKLHLRSVHATEKTFQCKICSNKFKSLDYLREHEKRHNKKFQCEICKSMHPRQGVLNEHIKLYHQNSETYKCEECNKEFKLKGNLKKHQKTHDKNRPKPFKCHRCDFATERQDHYNNHQKFHERQDKKFAAMKNPLKCQKCPTFHRNEKLLKQHTKFVHPEVQFQCDLCARFFNAKNTLKRHMKVHTRK